MDYVGLSQIHLNIYPREGSASQAKLGEGNNA